MGFIRPSIFRPKQTVPQETKIPHEMSDDELAQAIDGLQETGGHSVSALLAYDQYVTKLLEDRINQDKASKET